MHLMKCTVLHTTCCHMRQSNTCYFCFSKKEAGTKLGVKGNNRNKCLEIGFFRGVFHLWEQILSFDCKVLGILISLQIITSVALKWFCPSQKNVMLLGEHLIISSYPYLLILPGLAFLSAEQGEAPGGRVSLIQLGSNTPGCETSKWELGAACILQTRLCRHFKQSFLKYSQAGKTAQCNALLTPQKRLAVVEKSWEKIPRALTSIFTARIMLLFEHALVVCLYPHTCRSPEKAVQVPSSTLIKSCQNKFSPFQANIFPCQVALRRTQPVCCAYAFQFCDIRAFLNCDHNLEAAIR